MKLKAPIKLHHTNCHIPSETTLQKNICGIHRGTRGDVEMYYPEMLPIVGSANVNLANYEIDIKVHMLMEGQYPCIPNWHCDNVPRSDKGKLLYDEINDEHLYGETTKLPMLLWLSDNPTTEFLAQDEQVEDVTTHGELDEQLRSYKDWLPTQKIEGKTWYSMDQLTPHRGSQCEEYTWRIFVRLTPKSIVTARPVVSVKRFHSQVYLPNNFHW